MNQKKYLLLATLAMLISFWLGMLAQLHMKLLVAALMSPEAQVVYHALLGPVAYLLKLLFDAVLRRVLSNWTPRWPDLPWRKKDENP